MACKSKHIPNGKRGEDCGSKLQLYCSKKPLVESECTYVVNERFWDQIREEIDRDQNSNRLGGLSIEPDVQILRQQQPTERELRKKRIKQHVKENQDEKRMEPKTNFAARGLRAERFEAEELGASGP